MTILRERCDGNRNLLHACVSMCAPVSNKDHEAGKFSRNDIILSRVIKRNISIIFSLILAVREMELDQTTTHMETSHTEEPLAHNYGWPNEAFDSASGDEDSIGLIPMPGTASSAKSMPNLSSTSTSTTINPNTGGPYITDPTERRNNALLILKLLCESPVLQPHIKELLTGK